MEDLIKKVYQEKMTDGSFEKIVSDNFKKMVEDACSSLFTWQGPIKKQMEEKIKEVMSGVLEKTDFSSYVTKLETVINESLKNSPLDSYKAIAEYIEKIVGIKSVEFNQKIKLSDILEAYGEYIKEQLSESDFDDDEINRDDGTKTAYLECYVEVDRDESRGYFSSNDRKIVRLTHEKSDDHEDTIIEFKLEKDYKGRYGVQLDTNFRISDLKYLPKFVLYLLELQQQWAEIEIDMTDDYISVEFEFEWDIS